MEIKKFIPPFITDFVRRNKRVIKYKSYEEALSGCHKHGYHNEDLCNMIADKTIRYIESLKNEPLVLNPTTIYLAFGLNYFVNEFGQKEITVLDFGGACGVHYYEVRNILSQSILIKWIVIETEPMIHAAIGRGLASDELSYVSNIEDVSSHVDFVHSSSALQYVSSPYLTLEKLINLRSKMMLFNRMMFNMGSNDIITVQRSLFSANGPGKLPSGYVDRPIVYPHTTMSFQKFQSQITNKNYKCLSEFDEPSGRISLGKERIAGKGLIYTHHIQ